MWRFASEVSQAKELALRMTRSSSQTKAERARAYRDRGLMKAARMMRVVNTWRAYITPFTCAAPAAQSLTD
jgi:hypothetical protein